MKNKIASKNGFFTFRVLIGVLLCFSAIRLVLFALGKASAQPQTAPALANKIAPEVLADTAGGKSASVVIFLNSKGVAYQSFWAANMLVVTADRALVEALAARPDVARVDSNRPTRWIEDPSIANFGVTPSNPSVVEWGVQNVN